MSTTALSRSEIDPDSPSGGVVGDPLLCVEGDNSVGISRIEQRVGQLIVPVGLRVTAACTLAASVLAFESFS